MTLTDNSHPHKPVYLSSLGSHLECCFDLLGNMSDFEDAILNIKRAVELVGDDHPIKGNSKAKLLSKLGCIQGTHFRCLGHFSDLRNAILNIGIAGKLTDDRDRTKPGYFWDLGLLQQIQFGHLGNLTDLENAILNMERVINLRDKNDPRMSRDLSRLGGVQKIHFEHLGDVAERAHFVSSFRAAVQRKTAYPGTAIHAACQWAEILYLHGDFQSALNGNHTALELLLKVAWLGLDLHLCQNLLLLENSDNLGCLAATCAIQLGNLEEAIKLLDMGQSVFWHQESSLQSDLEMLREKEPLLAEELERIGLKLNEEAFTNSPSAPDEHYIDNDQWSAKSIGMERCLLVDKWETLVERVRQLPMFKYFLKPIPYCQLSQAVVTEQVVIINVSWYGVDTLIFGGTSHQIAHVSLPQTDFPILSEFATNILIQPPTNASVIQWQRYNTHYLQPALRHVWNEITIHIFDKMQILLNGSASTPKCRIWWYPTGPFAFIPIHATGPKEGGIDTSNLVISSYVTTLSSLFQAQHKQQQAVKGGL